MTSSLLTPTLDLARAVIAALVAKGYPYDGNTMSFNKYLATALTGISGTPYSELTTGLAQLLAGLVVALGGEADPSQQNDQTMMAAIIDLAA